VRCQCFLQRPSEAPRLSVDDVNAGALDGRERRNRAHLAQSLLGTHWKIEPGRVCSVDHVQVVVAREAENESSDPRILRESVRELGPLRRTASVNYVSGDQDEIERITRVDRVQFSNIRGDTGGSDHVLIERFWALITGKLLEGNGLLTPSTR
jgi:hypothetical protein